MTTPIWTTSCPDWQTRIVAGHSLIPAPIFPAEAAAAMEIFKDLRIVDAAGSPTIGEACRPWVFEFAEAIFGAYDAESGRRLLREFFVCVSKKNSKSTIAGAIMLTALLRNWRQSAEFLILSPTVEIAQNSFIPVRDMIRTSEELSNIFLIQEHIRTVTDRRTNATLKVIAADANSVGGKKAVGVLIDELFLFGSQPKAENMILEACGGLASRPEGFVIFLSTMSDEAPAGVFRQKLQYARGVRDGTIDDPAFLPLIYEFPPAMIEAGEHMNPDNFYVTNPNLGASVDVAFLEREFMKAKDSGRESVCIFLSKHMNVEIGLAMQSDRWAGAPFWEACAVPRFELEELIARSDVIDVGIDGGGLDDLLGIAVLGRDKETGKWLLWVRAWAHPSVLERRKSEAARFHDFEKDGDLVMVERIGDDVQQVADIVALVEKSGKLDAVGVDPIGLGGILDAMIEVGVPQDKVIGISQGWKMSGAIMTSERRVAEGNLEHSGQPLMSWTIGNVKIEPRGNSQIATKAAAGKAKIDNFLAFLNCVTLMSLVPESSGNSFWMNS